MEAPVVVVGGGFAGVEVALNLRRLDRSCPVVLLGPSSSLLYRPGMVRLLSGDKKPGDLDLPLAGLLGRQGVQLTLGRCVEVDLERRRLRLADGSSLSFAQLVLAAGARSDRDRVPGAREHALFPCEMEDALAMISRLDDPRTSSVTLLLGWERLGPGLEYFAWIMRTRPHLRLSLVDVEARLPGHLGSTALLRLEGWLKAAGALLYREGCQAAVAAGEVQLDGRRLPSDLTLMASPLAGQELGLAAWLLDGRGFVRVGPTSETEIEGIFAHGDLAAFPPEASVPRTMVWARSRAPRLARNVLARRRGLEPELRLDQVGSHTMLPDLGGRTLWVRDGRLLASGSWPLILRRIGDFSYLARRR